MLRIILVSLLLMPALLHAKTSIIVLDVKEGQAVLIKHNSEGVLIDTGHMGQSTAVLNKLHQYGVKNITDIILTHLHPDHASGYFRLKEAFPSATIYSNCQPLPSNIQPDTTRWLHETLQKTRNHRCLAAGSSILFFDSRLTMLWPHKFLNNNLNQHSLVINIAVGEKNILVMGDAGIKAEQALILENALPKRISALIVGHHGANDATSYKFLRMTAPEVAVISVNKNNVRGYPADSTLKRLNDMGIKTLRTDIHGDISVY